MTRFQNSIAIAKTKKSFLQQANVFSKQFGDYDINGEAFLFDLEGEDTFLLRQNIKDSFFSKIYRAECIVKIYDVKGFDDFDCKLQLKGMIGTKGSLVNIRGDKEYVNLFNQYKTLSKFNILLREVQIETITVNYSSDEEKLTVKITPYAGSMVWMIIPPIAYQVKIWDKEIESISKLINLIYDFTKQFQRDGEK
ncbi:MAG: hypothetical protein WCF96_05425 [Eubacteriales bacterium]